MALEWTDTIPASRGPRLAPWLLAAFLAAVALVTDESVFRAKVAWGEVLLMMAACTAALEAAGQDRMAVPWPGFLGLCLLPAAWAVAHVLWLADPVSRSLATDEVARLALAPLGAWTAAVCLAHAPTRRVVLGVLALVVVPVAVHAMAQKLAAPLQLRTEGAARAYASFGNPVFLGAWLVLTLPLCAMVALYGRQPLKWAGAVATGFGIPALLATGTRSAWLGGAVAAAVAVVLLVPTGKLRRRLLGGGLLLAAALLALFQEELLRPHAHRLIWRDTLSMVSAAPLGVGPGQFPLAFLPFASQELLAQYPRSAVIINDAHSEPLQVAAELGWPGVLLVLAMLAVLVRSLLGALREHRMGSPGRPVLAGAVAGIAGALAQALVSPDLRFVVTTMTLGVVIGVAMSFGRVKWHRVPGGPVGRALLALLAVVGMAAAADLARGQTRLRMAGMPALVPSPERQEHIRELLGTVREHPGDPRPFHELGNALSDEHLFPHAALYLRRAVLAGKSDLDLMADLGYAETRAGQFGLGAEHLRLALSARPDDLWLRFLLARCQFGLGELAEAAAELEAILAQDPAHPQAVFLMRKLRE